MIEVTLPAGSVATLLKYLLQWLRGLDKASEERKAECIHAIESVIAGVRQTQRYCRERDMGSIDPEKEARLAGMWTDLGFQLESLGVRKLAKRCDVKGQYWANPKKFSEEWWDQAEIGLESVDELARRIKAEIKANGAPAVK